jgi:hypothetical protein
VATAGYKRPARFSNQRGVPGAFCCLFLDDMLMLKRLVKYLDDIFYWLGVALLSAAAAFLHPAASLAVAGVFCLVFAFLIGKAGAKA